MRFHIVYRERAIRWQGNLLATAIKDCMEELGFEATINIDKVHPDYKNEALFLVDPRAAVLMEGFKWAGPVFIYNVIEAYVDPENWVRQFQSYSKGWGSKLDYVLDYSPRNVSPINSMGIKCVFAPMGYHKLFENRKEGPNIYGICFFGNWSARRRRMIGYLNKQGIKVGGQVTDEERSSGVKNANMLRSWLHLHMHQYRTTIKDNFPATRIMMLCAPNKIPVICEQCCWSPLKDGEHYIVFPKGDVKGLHRAVKNAKKSPEEMSAMAQRCYDFITTKYLFVDHLRNGFKELGFL